MYWAIISFMCSINGCTPLPQLDFKLEGTASQCRIMRDAIVKPNMPVKGDVWIEAYCTAIGGQYP